MDRENREFVRQLTLSSLFHFVDLIITPFAIPDDERLDLSENVHGIALPFIQDERRKRKGLLMPRYFLKSFCVTQSKPIWDYLRNHNERILIGHEVFDIAQKFLLFIKKNIEENYILHYFFPEIVLPDSWSRNNRWSSEALDMPRTGVYKEPSFWPIGVGGSSQGLHATKCYLDDIFGKKARDSEVVRNDTRKWFGNVNELLVTPDVTKPTASNLYVIGTHWAPGDIYTEIQDNDPRYEWKIIPAEDNQGNPTWPEKMSSDEIDRMKADPNDSIIFYTQMQNNPMQSNLTDFDVKWLKYYTKTADEEGNPAIEYTDQEKRRQFVLVKDLTITATIDPAVSSSKSKDTARTAIVIVGIDRETGSKIVLEAWAARIGEPKQLYKQVFEFHKKYHPRRWGIETFAQQNFILKAIREKARDVGTHIPISELPKDVGKNAKDIRIRALQDDFSCGGVYIHESMRDFRSEYLAFPMGQTKDLLDALAYHKQYWKKKKTVKEHAEALKRWADYKRNVNPITGY